MAGYVPAQPPIFILGGIMTRKESKQRDRDILMAFNEGCKVNDIAEKFGVSISKVRAVTKKETHEDKQKKYKRMREYKAEGHTMQEVADEFGVAQATAQYVCKGIAPQKSTPPTNDRGIKGDNEVASFIAERQKGFEYAGNYTGADGTVDLKCKECGSITTRSMITVRHNNIKCRECERIAKEKQEANKSVLKWFNGIVADIRKEEKRIKAQEREEARWHPCAVCGKPTKNKYTCSTKCSTKRNNTRKEQRRRIKIANALVDEDITLEGLYRRDKGICALCGEVCEWDDYEWRGGFKITGNNYPSLDHIIPIAKGGDHSWNNIQLAHRICNSLKADKVLA